MEKYMLDKHKVAQFRKPMTNPTALTPDTTALSPYLKFGSLGSRTFYWAIQDVYKSVGPHTKPPESLHGQMFFREFFYLTSYKTENFDKMIDNEKCKQIEWSDNKAYLKAWEDGMTGYPAIDATMR